MQVTIYTTTYCGFCQRAEDLLRRRGIAYRKVDVTTDPQTREELVERANGRRTVPVIFFDDRAIGGYSELAAMDARGELAAATAAEGAADSQGAGGTAETS
jgi:glutaredoxin 3